MKLFKENFFDPKWNDFLFRLMKNKAHESELKEFKAILIYDPRFRENFSNWIKAIRGDKIL